jgi:hypothetical protein
MRKIGVFIHVSLDGFFAGANDEIDWFKVSKKDAEWKSTLIRKRSLVAHSSLVKKPIR